MTKRWPYLAGLAVLILLAAAALANRSGLMDLVVEPVSRLSWLVTRSILSVSQEVYWTALIFVVLAFGLRLLPPRSRIQHESSYPSEIKIEDRAAVWARLIRRGNDSEDGRESFEKALSDLRVRAAEATGKKIGQARRLLPVRSGIRKAADWLPGGKARLDRDYEAAIVDTLATLETMMMEKQNDEKK